MLAKFKVFFNKCDFRGVQRSALCRSWRELSNAYLLAKFGFDTAENEASKVWRSGPVTLVYNICTKVSKYKYCTTIVQYFSPGRGSRSGAVSFDELMETIPKGREPQTKEEAQNNHRDRIKAALLKNSSRFIRTIISVKEDLVEKIESSL